MGIIEEVTNLRDRVDATIDRLGGIPEMAGSETRVLLSMISRIITAVLAELVAGTVSEERIAKIPRMVVTTTATLDQVDREIAEAVSN